MVKPNAPPVISLELRSRRQQRATALAIPPMRPWLALFALLGALLLHAPLLANEFMVFLTVVNEQNFGDRYYRMAEDGGFYAKATDLQAYGVELGTFAGEASMERGEQWVLLSSLAPDLQYELSSEELVMQMTVRPALMQSVTVDLESNPLLRPGTVQPTFTSGFWNYALDGECLYPDPSCVMWGQSEVGVHLDGMLVFTDLALEQPGLGLVRGMSYLRKDFPRIRRTLFVGDVVAAPSRLGSGGALLGIGYGTDNALDPYFVSTPTMTMASETTTPSTLEIYSNGNLVSRERLPPGRFEVTNLRPMVGEGDMRLVIRDAFGREHVVTQSYYLSPTMLARGLEEKSLSLGLARMDRGRSSFSYGGPALYGKYRRGVFNWLTLGGNLEAAWNPWGTTLPAEGYLAALEADILVLNTALFATDIALSLGPRGLSGAYGMTAQWLRRPFSLDASFYYFDRDHRGALSGTLLTPPRLIAQATAGLGMNLAGNVRATVRARQDHSGENTLMLLMNYSRRLPWDFSFLVTGTALQRFADGAILGDPNASINVTLMRSFGRRYNSSLSTGSSLDGGPHASLRVQKSPPPGEGWGGSANIGLSRQQLNERSYLPTVNLYGTFNAPQNVFQARLMRYDDGGLSYGAGVGGALVLVNSRFFAARPVYDAFGVVKVGELPNVGVQLRNQEIGKTNEKGEILLPELFSFDLNKVGVVMGDLPFEYKVDEIEKYLVPNYRGGVFFDFAARRFSAVTGHVTALKKGEVKPLKLGWLSVVVDGIERSGPTGFGGEFYLEDLPAGSFEARFSENGDRYRCPLVVPEPDSYMMELGEVRCVEMENSDDAH